MKQKQCENYKRNSQMEKFAIKPLAFPTFFIVYYFTVCYGCILYALLILLSFESYLLA